MDCTGHDQVELRFNHDFHYYSSGGNEQGDVDVRSAATGGAWVNVANFSGGDISGNAVVDITAQALDQTDVEIRFHYYGASYDWWWAVDDIEILGGEFVCGDADELFADGFESGDTSAWSLTTPYVCFKPHLNGAPSGALFFRRRVGVCCRFHNPKPRPERSEYVRCQDQ